MPHFKITTVPTTKSLRFFIGFLEILGPKTSKKPIKNRTDLMVGTVFLDQSGGWKNTGSKKTDVSNEFIRLDLGTVWSVRSCPESGLQITFIL